MDTGRELRGLYSAVCRVSAALIRPGNGNDRLPRRWPVPKIGIALGGGFARGIAHAGVLEVLERHGIPIHCITGVSAGSIVAAAYASGTQPEEIARAGCAMRFADVARWQFCRMGFAASERMTRFLRKLCRNYRFEEMTVPLGVVATDLASGEAVPFHGSGDVFLAIRASCAYPGLFEPVHWEDRMLVDGAISVEVPALLARRLGATHVVSVHLPTPDGPPPGNMFQVVNRRFQILQGRMEEGWRAQSDLVIAPDVSGVGWDGFASGPLLVQAGRISAEAAIPSIRRWFAGTETQTAAAKSASSPGLLATSDPG